MFSTSLAMILPFGPEPLTPFKETPFSNAIVFANGEAMIRSVGADVDEVDLTAGSDFGSSFLGSSFLGSSLAGVGAAAAAGSPASAAVKSANAGTSLSSST
ncbi:unnamed protein product [[Candida] boidinii]|nr:unnamed protein product [[Candida] boidinii]